MAHKGRGHRLDIIRVTAVHMIKVHPPRDGRTGVRGRAKRPERRGRKAGWPDHLGLGQIIKKTARPPSITIVIRSGQFAMSFPLAIAADLENGGCAIGCADEFWSAAPLQKEERCAPFVSDLVLELARWVTWLTLMFPASASSFGQWVSSGWYVGCASGAADATERPRLSLTVPPPSLRSPVRPTANCA